MVSTLDVRNRLDSATEPANAFEFPRDLRSAGSLRIPNEFMTCCSLVTDCVRIPASQDAGIGTFELTRY